MTNINGKLLILNVEFESGVRKAMYLLSRTVDMYEEEFLLMRSFFSEDGTLIHFLSRLFINDCDGFNFKLFREAVGRQGKIKNIYISENLFGPNVSYISSESIPNIKYSTIKRKRFVGKKSLNTHQKNF